MSQEQSTLSEPLRHRVYSCAHTMVCLGLVGCFPGKERSQPEEAAQRAIGLPFGKMSEPTQFLPLALTREGPGC